MTVLVPNATRLEAALDGSIDARLTLPTHRVTATWSPANCPIDQLGFLAWQLGLELWDDAWPEVKKRQVCANAFALHRSKTTLAGIRAHLALVDCTVDRVIRPPARGFLRAAMTDAQRAAWLDSLPQLRLYPFARPAIAVRRSFYRSPAARYGGARFDGEGWDFSATAPTLDAELNGIARPVPHPVRPRTFGARGAWRTSRGPQLLAQRATYFDRGTERPIAHERAADGSVRLLIGRTTRRGFNGHGFVGHGFGTRSVAGAGIVTLNLADDVASFAVAAGLDPISVAPTRVAEPRVAPRSRAFAGRHRAGTFLRASWAPNLIHDRVSLHAPDRLGERRRTRSFHGRGRFGIAPFTAELRVDVPMHRVRQRSGNWHGSGFRRAADLTPVARALEAIRVSKAARDTILVDTTTTRTARFGDGLAFGGFAFGELRKAA